MEFSKKEKHQKMELERQLEDEENRRYLAYIKEKEHLEQQIKQKKDAENKEKELIFQ